MTLEILWFCLLAFFWTAYFVLEGFDFGVGMLLPVLGRSEGDRGMMFESIGPLWDGNEVWLVIAGGATFAAFPVWYATMFSGFYLALLLILGLLIVRVLSFEWREKAHGRAWKGFWAWMNTIGSIGAPFRVGRRARQPSARHPDRVRPDLRGRLRRSLQRVHDRRRDRRLPALRAPRCGLPHAADARRPPRALPADGVSPRTCGRGRRRGLPRLDARRRERRERQGAFPGILPVAVAAVAAVAAVFLVRAGNERWAFVATATTIGAAVVTLFVSLYPRVMVSDPEFGNSLTIDNASSAHYSLTVMTVVAAVLLPIVLLYTGVDVSRLPRAARR